MNRAKNRFIRWAALLAAAAFAACAHDPVAEPLAGAEPVRLALHAADGVKCRLWMFVREHPDGEYLLRRQWGEAVGGMRLDIPLGELRSADLRFMALAQPRDEEWLSVRGADCEGDAWSGVRLESATGAASLEAFGTVVDTAGMALSEGGRIALSLRRIAGQVRFACYRMGATLDEVEGVRADSVASVLDRVTRIEIVYTGLTTVLGFDEANRFVPLRAEGTQVQLIDPTADGRFTVALPQEALGLGVYAAAARGSLLVDGLPLLPSAGGVHCTFRFHYLDTTPLCGAAHAEGEHTAACFRPMTLDLKVPAEGALGMDVRSDWYTLVRAGLRCDRIIDTERNFGPEADFTWE